MPELIHNDLRITDVVLVHKQWLPGGFRGSYYQEGRNVEGTTCIITGHMKLIYKDGYEDVLGPGAVALMPRTIAYRFHVSDEDEYCQHYTMNFFVNTSLITGSRTDRAYIIYPANFARYLQAYEDCVQAWEQKLPGYKMIVLGILYRVIRDILFEQFQSRIDPYAYEQITPALNYMSLHCQQNLSLSQLADLCNLSVSHFRRVFKTIYSVSPISYLLNLRLEKSKELLMIYDYSIETIAELAGFQSTSYFVRFFNKHVGMTPLKYRKSILFRTLD